MKVSVCVITYNQAAYISAALDGVLAQETDFPWEIIVGEDESTDGTREIVLDYQRRHPERIRVLLQHYPADYVRVNGRNNFMTTIAAARGEYVALLEGDDYWTSPHKLRKQVELLDAHPDCSSTFHDVAVVYADAAHDGGIFPHIRTQQQIFTLKDLLTAKNTFVPTCSLMFRRGLFGDFPAWFATTPIGDWPLNVLNAEHGPFFYLPECLGAYRIHAGGIFSGISALRRINNSIGTCEILNRSLDYRYDRWISVRIAIKLLQRAAVHLQTGEKLAAFADIRAAVLRAPHSPQVYGKTCSLLYKESVRKVFRKRRESVPRHLEKKKP